MYRRRTRGTKSKRRLSPEGRYKLANEQIPTLRREIEVLQSLVSRYQLAYDTASRQYSAFQHQLRIVEVEMQGVGLLDSLFSDKKERLLARKRELEAAAAPSLRQMHDNDFRALNGRLWSLRNSLEYYERMLNGVKATVEGRALKKAQLKAKQQAQRAEKREREKAKQKEDRALVARAKGKDRAASARLKRQLERSEFCPYCGYGLGDSPEADHIHPLALGGLAAPWNLVFVCRICNARKGALTLNEFIEKFNIDRRRLFEALKALGKRF